MDAGYNAEHFVDFCSKGYDLEQLESWSMQQVKDVVELFIQQEQQRRRDQDRREGQREWRHDVWKQDNLNKQSFQQHPPAFLQSQLVWKQFETVIDTTVVKPAEPTFNPKPGLVFTDDDWSLFLGESMLPAQKKKASMNQAQPANPIGPTIAHSKSRDVIPNPLHLQTPGKDNPLSPPTQGFSAQKSPCMLNPASISIPPINLTLSAVQSPINLTNIQITTVKEKALPPLPQITDVTVINTTQVSRSFLQSDYTLYTIRFAPGQQQIDRKFHDFRRLRVILQRLYPHIRLPYIQPQGWLMNSSQGRDAEIMARYKSMITEFLKYILIHNCDLSQSALVRTFCGFDKDSQIKDKEYLKRVLEHYEAASKPRYIGELSLSKNKLMFAPTCNAEKLVSNTQVLLTDIDSAYQRLRKQLDNLFCNYELVSKSLAEVAGTFESLQNLIKKYNYNNDNTKDLRVFEGLKEICTRMQENLTKHINIFRLRLKPFLRYECNNMWTLKEVIDIRNKIHWEYAKQSYPILTGGASKTGVMQVDGNVPLEQPIRSNKNLLAIQQIFWANMTTQCIQEYWQLLRSKINEHITIIAYDELDNENSNLNFWNNLIKKCLM